MAEAQALVRRTLHVLTHLPIGEVRREELFVWLQRVHRWMPELLGDPTRESAADWTAEEVYELCAEVLALDYQRRSLLRVLGQELRRRGVCRLDRARWLRG